MTLPLRLYRLGMVLATPFVPLLLRYRARRGKELIERLPERDGIATRARPPGDLVWVHGASVGETLAALGIVTRLAASGGPVLVTSGTVTSARLMAERLPAGVVHQFLPTDTVAATRRFLATWRPGLAILVESELWPNLIRAAGEAGVPMVVANARMSDRSYARWRRTQATARALLDGFRLVLARTEEDAVRYRALGAERVQVVGDLKQDAEPPARDAAAVAALREAIGVRPVILASSVHPGEIAALTDLALALRRRPDAPVPIIVPRHPDKAGQFLSAFQEAGLRVARRSLGDSPATADLYLADTIGEMGSLLAISTAAFIGGSLAPHGGQNPVEAAASGVPLLHGPHTRNFADLYARLDEAGGAIAVADGADLVRGVAALLDDPARRDGVVAAGRAVLAAGGGALDRTFVALTPFLPGLPAR